MRSYVLATKLYNNHWTRISNSGHFNLFFQTRPTVEKQNYVKFSAAKLNFLHYTNQFDSSICFVSLFEKTPQINSSRLTRFGYVLILTLIKHTIIIP